MEVIIFGKILDVEAVNTERKGGIAWGVVQEAGGLLHGPVSVRG